MDVWYFEWPRFVVCRALNVLKWKSGLVSCANWDVQYIMRIRRGVSESSNWCSYWWIAIPHYIQNKASQCWEFYWNVPYVPLFCTANIPMSGTSRAFRFCSFRRSCRAQRSPATRRQYFLRIMGYEATTTGLLDVIGIFWYLEYGISIPTPWW